MSLITLVSLMLFYIGLFQALLAPMILSFTTAVNLGVSQSICSLGMLISSLIIILTERKRKNAWILSVSLGVMGIFFSVIGITESLWAIIIPGFFFFLTIPYLNSSIDVLIRKNIDNEKQGRVWSFVSVITYFGSLLAYASAGFLADKVFNPLFMPGGFFAHNLGHIFGIGNGRGISFIFFLSGLFIIILSFFVLGSKSIWQLETPSSLQQFEEKSATPATENYAKN